MVGWVYFKPEHFKFSSNFEFDRNTISGTGACTWWNAHIFVAFYADRCALVLLQLTLSVREITKSSSTFSATNISSNIVWLLQLNDTIQMKSIFGTIFSSIYLAKVEKRWFFDYHLLTCSMRKMVFICLMQNIDMCLLYKSHQIARLVSHLINHFSKWVFTVQQENATKCGSKNEILHIFLYH